MVGVPAAGAVTNAVLFGAGFLLVAILAVTVRARLRALSLVEALVAAALLLSAVAVPWIGWRFVEDLRTTTQLDSYERANMGPVQAYLPGYLLDRARTAIPAGAGWAVAVGPSSANPLAQRTFASLALITLFPRPSEPIARTRWIIGWGVDPAHLRGVSTVRVVRPRQGSLPPVLLGERRP
jgi:hypothetical protein